MSIDEIKIPLSNVISLVVGMISVWFFSYLREKGKNLATREDIAKITAEIEGVKLHYAGQSRIHERQIDILSKLYKCLLEAQEYSKLMTKSVIFTGEKPDEYPKLLQASVTKAYKEYTMGLLLLPGDVAGKVDTFFQKVSEEQRQLEMANHPMVADGQERAKFWKKAGTIAYQEIPALLRSIEEQARNIIQGSNTNGKQDA